jgi:heat shock protein HslJ
MQTTMACEAIRNWQEGQYFHNLGSVERYTLSPGRLTFFSAGGDVLLVFEEKGVQPPASLRTTQWELISFHRGDTVFSVLPGTAITALFKDDGTLSGSAGCNEYHAVFTSDGAALSVGAIGTTKKNCANPEGIMVQESTYTAALVLVRSYSIDGNNLLLKNENGQIILSFRAADAT